METKLNINADDFMEGFMNEILFSTIKAATHYFSDSLRVKGKFEDVHEHMKENYPHMNRYHQLSADRVIYADINKKFMFYACKDDDKDNLWIGAMGEEETAEAFLNKIQETFPEFKSAYISWVYNIKNEKHQKDIPFTVKNVPTNEMYPWLETSLNDYYDKFVASDSPVLLLIGEPGTGKTSFLKGLIHHTNKSACVSYDDKILSDDEFFVDFLTDNEKEFLIIEDSDLMLEKRSKGNSMMNRFLNISDGLISFGKKKLIFTTNLESLEDVDEALIRKGRCFDVLQFRALTRKEAETLANKNGIDLPEGDEFTIADIFCEHGLKAEKEEAKPKFGFV